MLLKLLYLRSCFCNISVSQPHCAGDVFQRKLPVTQTLCTSFSDTRKCRYLSRD